MTTDTPHIARMRNTATGQYRIVCRLPGCTYTSDPYDAEWKADAAAASHAESVHGRELGPYRPAEDT